MRVVIAEDLFLLREGLASLLKEHGFDIAEAVGDGPSLLRALLEHRPDVAIVDVRLPPAYTDEGLRAALDARRQVPGLPVLILSTHVERLYARELLADRAGGVGYLLKDRVFTDAMRTVARGGTVMDPEVVAKLLARRSGEPPVARLSPGNVTSSRCWPRAGPTARSPSGWSSRRRQSASTAPASSASSTCHRPGTTTAGCWPCSLTWTADRPRRAGTGQDASFGHAYQG